MSRYRLPSPRCFLARWISVWPRASFTTTKDSAGSGGGTGFPCGPAGDSCGRLSRSAGGSSAADTGAERSGRSRRAGATVTPCAARASRNDGCSPPTSMTSTPSLGFGAPSLLVHPTDPSNTHERPESTRRMVPSSQNADAGQQVARNRSDSFAAEAIHDSHGVISRRLSMRRPPLRRILLTALPKVVLSRLCGRLCSLPLPRWFRPRLYAWFARRYGASLDEMRGSLADFVSLQQFFRRPLREGARPIAPTPLVWPCDGRIITSGRVANQRIAQVKGQDYALADLLGDAALARSLEGGSQVTIYLAPGDYHRVHAPFGAEIERVTGIRGALFPVHPPAVVS